MTSQHAPIGFSTLPRIVRCHGSRKLALRVPPKPDGPEAIEGRVGHWVAYQLYNGVRVPLGTIKDSIKVDEEMLNCAELWVATVPKDAIAELPVVASSIHPTDCWGTPDLYIWDPVTKTLYVYEYKYGHMIVDEFENQQLIGQAAGIIDTLGIRPKHIHLTIVQPRIYTAPQVRTWPLTIEEFPEYLKVIQDAIADEETTSVSPHCMFCPAAEICATFQRAASQVVQFAGTAEATLSTPDQIGAELTVLTDAIDLLKARRTVAAEMAESHLRAGTRVNGWGMSPGRANRAWNIPDEEVLATGTLLGINLAKPAAPITPTQALDRKLLDEEALKGLASRPTPPMKLSPISTSLTRRIFK